MSVAQGETGYSDAFGLSGRICTKPWSLAVIEVTLIKSWRCIMRMLTLFLLLFCLSVATACAQETKDPQTDEPRLKTDVFSLETEKAMIRSTELRLQLTVGRRWQAATDWQPRQAHLQTITLRLQTRKARLQTRKARLHTAAVRLSSRTMRVHPQNLVIKPVPSRRD